MVLMFPPTMTSRLATRLLQVRVREGRGGEEGEGGGRAEGGRGRE